MSEAPSTTDTPEAAVIAETPAAEVSTTGAEEASPGLLGQVQPDAPVEGEAAAEPQSEGQESAEPQEGAQEGDGEPQQGVPEKYEFNLPEGFELDAELVDEFTPIAKEAGLSQETAQQFAELFQKGLEKQRAAAEQAYEQTIESWKAQVEALPESKRVLADAARALDRFAPDDTVRAELRAELLGTNPSVIRLLANVQKLTGQDGFAGSSKPTGESEAGAQALYPNSNMNP